MENIIITTTIIIVLYFILILPINFLSYYIYRRLGLKVPNLVVNKSGNSNKGEIRYEIKRYLFDDYIIYVYETCLVKQDKFLITQYNFIPFIPINVYHLVEKCVYRFTIGDKDFYSFSGDKEKFKKYVDELVKQEERKKEKEKEIDNIISNLNS